ncbi:hypothetical protein BRC81_04200 [Halobacteriales archaeon QS_1_68_20]|nr:MAG: hypothetical protein BRC81_04200 [Halobacteriales archaeon QS_1_68_20]
MEDSDQIEHIRRRSLFRRGIPVALAGLAGCLDGATGPNDKTATDERSFDTPAPGECEQVSRPQPTPTNEGLQPRKYPSYPQSLDKDAAKQFAEEYERVYQHNYYVAEEFIHGIDDISTGAGVARAVEDAGEYFVGVNGRIDTADLEQPEGTGTSTPSPAATSSSSFAAWYYLTDRFALRREVSGGRPDIDEGDDPNLQGATVVVCN